MAKKATPLSVSDIILHADAQTIQQALEARTKIDELLVQREEAYQKIDAIEQQVEEWVGDEGLFVYPAPPAPVAGFNKVISVARPKPVKPVSEAETAEDVPDEDVDPTTQDAAKKTK